jgi:hypothetical protein
MAGGARDVLVLAVEGKLCLGVIVVGDEKRAAIVAILTRPVGELILVRLIFRVATHAVLLLDRELRRFLPALRFRVTEIAGSRDVRALQCEGRLLVVAFDIVIDGKPIVLTVAVVTYDSTW